MWGKGCPLCNTSSPLQPLRFSDINPAAGAQAIWDFGGNCQAAASDGHGSYVPYNEQELERAGIPGLPGPEMNGLIKCWAPGGFSLPLAAVLTKTSDTGVALGIAPTNKLLDIQLDAFTNNTFTLTSKASDPRGRLDVNWPPIDPSSPVVRPGYRFSSTTAPVTISMDIFGTHGDTRDALGAYHDAFSEFFEPPNPAIHQMAGLGTYTSVDVTAPQYVAQLEWL